jgi:2-(1,2-epoxy-1,2-dihydrophenyl)acetyl-CoA isomerase
VDERLTSREFRVTTLLHEIPAVTVAAINGACAGAGLGWALACDLRLMTARARLNTAFLDVAVAGDMAIPWSLPRLVGAGRARDLSFLPRRILADEALAIGLVARIFPDDSFRDDVESVLTSLLEKSPTALLGLKSNYVMAERLSLSDFVDHEAEQHLRIAASADTAEAFQAFVEKRKPKFA